MTSAERWARAKAAQRLRRIAAHRCTMCGEKLPADHHRKNCEPCLDKHRLYNAHNYERVIAERLKRAQSPGVVAVQPRTRCPRCHLLLPHDNCYGSIYAFASIRREAP